MPKISDTQSVTLSAASQRDSGSLGPRISPALLRLALAWEIQASARSGLSRTTQQRLAQLGQGKTPYHGCAGRNAACTRVGR